MKKHLIALLMLCLTSSLALAISPADQLNQMLSHFTSLQARFSQLVRASDGAPMQESKGDLNILRPGKFYWKQTSPMVQVIVTNGKKLWIYEPDLKQVTERTVVKMTEQTPLLLLTQKNVLLQNQFTVKRLTTKRKGEWFQLTPKKTEAFKTIELGFVNKQIKTLMFENALDNQTVIQLKHVKVNQPVNASQFNFQVPAGVDVVHE
jgi:outer membrane lipoprotein carrier protein